MANKKERPAKKAAPQKVNNYTNNKPVVARSLNVYPRYRPDRNVKAVEPVVNAKVADEKLIHKPKEDVGQTFFPVIEKGVGGNPISKNIKKTHKNSK